MADSVAEIEGMMAARDGLAIDQNPYPEGSAEAMDWDAGFNYIQEGGV